MSRLSMHFVGCVESDHFSVHSISAHMSQSAREMVARGLLWERENQKWPPRPFHVLLVSRPRLYRTNLLEHLFKCDGHALVHFGRIVPFQKTWSVSIACKQSAQLWFRDSCKDGRIRDLVPIQM